MASIKVLVSSDQSLLRELLAVAIGKDRRFALAGESRKPLGAPRLCRQTGADVLLLDLDGFPWDSIDRFKKALDGKQPVRVLGLTGRNDPLSVQLSMDAGFNGVFEKDKPLRDLFDALSTVGRGEKYFSKGARKRKRDVTENPKAFPRILTAREREIVALVGNCLTSHEIAEKLDVSVRTVETHRYNVMRKLGIRDTPGLIRYAFDNGLDQLAG